MYRYAPPGQISYNSVQLPGEADVQSDVGFSVVVNMPSCVNYVKRKVWRWIMSRLLACHPG
jgi:hypothetical protein